MHRDKLPDTDHNSIAFQQILEEDNSVFSIQTVVIPPGRSGVLNSAGLLRWYLDHIKRSTLGLIQPEENSAGISFRLAGTSVVIIQFSPPLFLESEQLQMATLFISGGVLVQPKECNRGQLDFMVEPTSAGVRVTLKLSDYCPLILGSGRASFVRKWLYQLTQAYLHKVVTIRFLATVYRKISGRKLAGELVRIAVRNGRDI